MEKFSGVLLASDFDNTLIYTEPALRTGAPVPELIGDGLLPLKEAQEQFGVELPVDEYDTFGGFVFSIHGSIPDDGETFELDTHSLHIAVKQISEHRIERATVRIIREANEKAPEEKGLFRKSKEKNAD